MAQNDLGSLPVRRDISVTTGCVVPEWTPDEILRLESALDDMLKRKTTPEVGVGVVDDLAAECPD